VTSYPDKSDNKFSNRDPPLTYYKRFKPFVSTTENGWLAFLGPNKREIVKVFLSIGYRGCIDIARKKKYQRRKKKLKKNVKRNIETTN